MGVQYVPQRRQWDKHRIIDDRIEKSIKERQIGHCTFAASIFKVQRLCQY